jgi:hypothetical protein
MESETWQFFPFHIYPVLFSFFPFTHSINATALKLQLTYAFSSRNSKQARVLREKGGGGVKPNAAALYTLLTGATSLQTVAR